MNKELKLGSEQVIKQKLLLAGELTTPHRRRRLARKMDPKVVAECFESGWKNYLEARINQGLDDPSVMRIGSGYSLTRYA